MRTAVRHLHRRDLQFIALIVLDLALIGLYLAAGVGGGEMQGASWRRIDTAAVRQRIDSGDLSGHQAVWYHAVDETPAPLGREEGPP